MGDFFDDVAALGSESDDEDYDEETGQTKRKETNGDIGDSSEEEDEDEDEEAERAVREGFIVEDEEDEEERKARRKEHRKRRRAEREEEEANLDEDDLDLIGVRRTEPEPKFKRLKRGHRDDRDGVTPRGAGAIFDSDEEDDTRLEPAHDELDDFIIDDFPADEGQDQTTGDREVERRGHAAMRDLAGMDADVLAEFEEVFGDGQEYDWALALQEDATNMEEGEDGEPLSKPIELQDVFEPSQLAERMMTEEDQKIRSIDVPERHQVARAPYKDLSLTEDQFKEEALWIANNLLPRKAFDPELVDPFRSAVSKVLEFMNVDDYEVPFIFNHRKDYLIHAVKNADNEAVTAHKLLTIPDLWTIFELDLKFRALIEKRNHLERTYAKLQDASELKDAIFEQMLPLAVTLEELQDVQDYLYFEHSARFADLAVIEGSGVNGTAHRKPGASRMLYDKIRKTNVYRLVRAYGISADGFAQNALKEGRREYTEDPGESPEQMAGSEDILSPPDYSSGAQCLRAARAMFAEEMAMHPKLRKVVRRAYYQNAVVECYRTDKGLRKIDDHHPYYEFKYLRDLQLEDFAQNPGAFLRMLKAEEEGLIEVRVRMRDREDFKKSLYTDLESDNFSEVADAWNRERRAALDAALVKLDKIMIKSIKETVKAECETEVAKLCKERYTSKLDQAPYKPKGEQPGTLPRVLALSNGSGIYGRDPMSWVYVEDDGRVLENGKFTDLSLADPVRETRDGSDIKALVELIARRKPDVIGISGFSVETRKLFNQLRTVIKNKDMRGAPFADSEDGPEMTELLEVVIVNDEIARLYQTSERANKEYPAFAPLTKYCIGLARYLQNPLKEYASLGRDVISLNFDQSQSCLPQDKLLNALEAAMVDMVNICGVNINDAVNDSYYANLLPYICGLGPRKAQHLLKVINHNGGSVMTRAELVGDVDTHKLPAVGPRVWNNCASFLWIEFEETEHESDYLDNTRIHPEDYELARKMAADALELDEEDVKAETDEHGDSAIVRKLVTGQEQDKVDDLILEEYAEQLESSFNSRKRATLESIRSEFHNPYEELRRPFEVRLPEDEVFTMFTGETPESLRRDMVVPMSIRRVNDDSIEGRLDCGMEAVVNSMEIMDNFSVSAKSVYQAHQAVQAMVLEIDYKNLKAEMTLLERKLRRAVERPPNTLGGEWDNRQEQQDKEEMQVKNNAAGRAQRVIKHPMFRPFNTHQAEEYLGSQARGECVIRPSSKGMDHLAITWKVSDSVYQHIDVLELDKDNEFALGKILKIGGRWSYSDLDELIFNHVKAMARKVEEMMLHEKYQSGTKAETERWLETYTEANPRRSVYAFCIDPKHPGYFHLCFKAGQNARLQSWPVKILPGAYELQKAAYQNMRGLCDGFKMQFANMQKARSRM